MKQPLTVVPLAKLFRLRSDVESRSALLEQEDDERSVIGLRRPCRAFLAVIAALTAALPLAAQGHFGRRFYVADPATYVNVLEPVPQFAITVVNPGTTAANVSIFNVIEGTTNGTVPPGGVLNFTFPDHEITAQGNTISNQPVYRVTSNQDVAVFASDPLSYVENNEGTLVLPTHALGKEYRVAHYVPYQEPQILVVATEPGQTNVQLFDTNETVMANVTLSQGSCLVRHVLSDMTGWKVVADRPVAAFTAQSEAMIDVIFEDPLFDQLLPEEMMAQAYAVAPLRLGPGGCTNSSNCAADLFRFVAHEDNTVLTTIPNVGGGTLNEGDFLEITTATDFVIQGTKPFAGFQYQSSNGWSFPPNPSPDTGDPALVSLLSVENFTNDYLVQCEASFSDHQLSVIAPFGVGLVLDGNPINPVWNLIGTIGTTQYGSMRIPVSGGVHRLSSSNYCFGLMVANYGYSGSELELGGFGNPGDGAMIRDTDDDFGIEPNPSSSVMWDSPDIWVRHFQDPTLQFAHQHQNPIPTLTNYLYVKLRNTSCSPLFNGTLVTYFSQASTGQAWSSAWIGNPLTGDVIGSQVVPFLPPQSEVVLEFPWVPAFAGPHGLLARYVSSSDPMTFPETTSVLVNATNNNNIAWKNVAVVALPPPITNEWTSTGYPVLVTNPYPVDLPFDVAFDGEGPARTAFLAQGSVELTLPLELFNAWQLAGGTSTGLELVAGTTTFRLLSADARLSGLPLAGLAQHALELRFALPPSRLFRPAPRPLHLRQYLAGSTTPEGGFTFEFTRRTTDRIQR